MEPPEIPARFNLNLRHLRPEIPARLFAVLRDGSKDPIKLRIEVFASFRPSSPRIVGIVTKCVRRLLNL
jgi:hypothetical protein